MVLTASTMLPLGTKAPAFALTDVTTGQTVTLQNFSGKKGLLVMFICCHCPYVKHIQEALSRLGKDYESSELGIVAISSNDVENYPDDSPDKLKDMARAMQFKFPVLFDETQAVAQAYTAACTPDFFLFDADFRLVYRGQLDDSRPGNSLPVTGKDLRGAIDAVLIDQAVPVDQKPSIGCNIKWKPGNEPRY